MARILSGREVADDLKQDLAQRTKKLKMRGVAPALAVIRIGDNPADVSYEKGALKCCESVGILCRQIHLDAGVSQTELLEVIDSLNEDDQVHGVLLLRPLPKGMDEALVTNRLRPEKDVDCMTDLSLSGLVTGRKVGFLPCTAEAAMACLDHYGIDCRGKRVTVIGRSAVFGKPASLMLIARDATVTVCHTKTKDLPSEAARADIIMVAAGHLRTLTADCVRPGQIVIDIGVNRNEEGRLCGDTAFEEVEPVVDAITPVPGGVGMITTSILAAHVVTACERQAG